MIQLIKVTTNLKRDNGIAINQLYEFRADELGTKRSTTA
jgi:hypothetical protein